MEGAYRRLCQRKAKINPRPERTSINSDGGLVSIALGGSSSRHQISSRNEAVAPSESDCRPLIYNSIRPDSRSHEPGP